MSGVCDKGCHSYNRRIVQPKPQFHSLAKLGINFCMRSTDFATFPVQEDFTSLQTLRDVSSPDFAQSFSMKQELWSSPAYFLLSIKNYT